VKVPNWIMVASVACTLPYFFGISCAAPSPATQASIAAADCVIDRTVAQAECVRDNDSGADIDACRAKVKAAKDCTKDGGQ
jgi:hypothetical protein